MRARKGGESSCEPGHVGGGKEDRLEKGLLGGGLATLRCNYDRFTKYVPLTASCRQCSGSWRSRRCIALCCGISRFNMPTFPPCPFLPLPARSLGSSAVTRGTGLRSYPLKHEPLLFTTVSPIPPYYSCRRQCSGPRRSRHCIAPARRPRPTRRCCCRPPRQPSSWWSAWTR